MNTTAQSDTQSVQHISQPNTSRFVAEYSTSVEAVAKTSFAVYIYVLLQQRRVMQVVRLKGGCTSFFSRAASEIAALHAAGIEFELVPGVTSASAAAADLGVPLTAGVDFKAVTLLSAHNAAKVDWRSYGPDSTSTLVLLMAGGAVAEIVAGCLAAGWPQSAPVRD